MGKFAAIGAFLAANAPAIGAASAITGAGVGIGSAVSQSRAAKKSGTGGGRAALIGGATPQIEPAEAKPVDKEEIAARRIGRASLISTSPSGVLTTAPTGRRKLLGN